MERGIQLWMEISKKPLHGGKASLRRNSRILWMQSLYALEPNTLIQCIRRTKAHHQWHQWLHRLCLELFPLPVLLKEPRKRSRRYVVYCLNPLTLNADMGENFGKIFSFTILFANQLKRGKISIKLSFPYPFFSLAFLATKHSLSVLVVTSVPI